MRNVIFQATPDVSGALQDGFGQMTTLITGTLVPLLFGIVILGLGITLGIKWLRKGAKSA